MLRGTVRAQVTVLYSHVWNQLPVERTARERASASAARHPAKAANWPPPMALDVSSGSMIRPTGPEPRGGEQCEDRACYGACALGLDVLLLLPGGALAGLHFWTVRQCAGSRRAAAGSRNGTSGYWDNLDNVGRKY